MDPGARRYFSTKDSIPLPQCPKKGVITPEALFNAAKTYTDEDTVIVTDVGQHQMWAAQFFPLAAPRRFITSGGLGTMGYGLPAALGAKVGCPKCKVVLFTGDGSILMNCQEFSTLHRYAVEVKVIVLQNGVLGMVKPVAAPLLRRKTGGIRHQ